MSNVAHWPLVNHPCQFYISLLKVYLHINCKIMSMYCGIIFNCGGQNQNFAYSLGRSFLGNWFIALQSKTIHYFVIRELHGEINSWVNITIITICNLHLFQLEIYSPKVYTFLDSWYIALFKYTFIAVW